MRGRPTGRDAVRAALVTSAAQLFAERGPASVSMRDVADAAQVNYGLIHRHFGTKDALVEAVVDDLTEGMADDLRDVHDAASAVEVLERHRELIRIYTFLCLENPQPSSLHRRYPVLKGFLRRLSATDPTASKEAVRVRASTATALALGWMVFESFLVEAGDLKSLSPEAVHRELSAALETLAGTDHLP